MTRKLDIIFYGLACFHKWGERYRVLFPDGRKPGRGRDIPAHNLSVWVRDRNQKPSKMKWLSARRGVNDFPLEYPCKLKISGLKRTSPVDDSELLRRLPILKKSDFAFKIAPLPETILTLMVDRGALSAHEHDGTDMIVVRWMVEVENNREVRFTFDGDHWIEITKQTKQVILANVSNRERKSDEDSDFNLYRKLAIQKQGKIQPTNPENDPLCEIPVIQPSGSLLCCPHIDCSPALSR
jgi:hypothetical protein